MDEVKPRRVKHPDPPPGTTCEAYQDLPKKVVCGDPAVGYVTVPSGSSGARIALCAHHKAEHDYEATSRRVAR